MKKVLVFALSLLLHQYTTGQTNQNIHFLQNVGVLDSLYSNTLKEHRKIYV